LVAKRGSQLYYVRKERAGQVALVGLPNVVSRNWSLRYGGSFTVVPVSARRGDGLERLREGVYKALDVVRVPTAGRQG